MSTRRFVAKYDPSEARDEGGRWTSGVSSSDLVHLQNAVAGSINRGNREPDSYPGQNLAALNRLHTAISNEISRRSAPDAKVPAVHDVPGGRMSIARHMATEHQPDGQFSRRMYDFLGATNPTTREMVAAHADMHRG